MYFFVSSKYLNEKIIYPQVPKTASSREDKNIKRICVSKSLLGAIQSTSIYEKYKRFYIYICNSKNTITPTRNQVGDGYLFGEEWILEPIKLELYKTVFVDKKIINKEVSHFKIYSKDEDLNFGLYDFDYKRVYKNLK